MTDTRLRRRLAAAGLLALTALTVLALRATAGNDSPTVSKPARDAAASKDTHDDTALLRRRHELASNTGEHEAEDHREPAQPSPLPPEGGPRRRRRRRRVDPGLHHRQLARNPEQRDTRLAPLLTDHARAYLSGGSSGAAAVADQHRRQETAQPQLASSQPLTVTADQATFLVVVHVTLIDRDREEVVERAYTVTVISHGDTWLVDDLAPAHPGAP